MQPKRLIFLDGLRGWGALTVVIYHVFIEIFPISAKVRDSMWKLFFFNGTFAVSIFFLVSGISLSIGFITSQKYNNLIKIALGRYFRLGVPIGIACFFVYAASLSGLILDPLHQKNAASFSADIYFAFFGVFLPHNPATSPIPPLWTMPIELLGSMIVLSTLAVAGRSRARFAFYIIIILISGCLSPFISSFIIGIAIAEYLAIPPPDDKSATHFGGIFLILAAASGALFLPGQQSGLYVIFSSIMIFGVINSPRTRQFLEMPFSRALGKISFPMYLLHSTIIFSAGVWLHSLNVGNTKLFILVANITTVVACLLFSSAFIWIDAVGIAAARVVVRWTYSVAASYPSKRM